jgi:hypothetical protein
LCSPTLLGAVITCRTVVTRPVQYSGARCLMLRRGLHRQCLSHHPLSQRLQNPTHRCPFSSIPAVEDDAFAEGEKTSATHAYYSRGGTPCPTPATLLELQTMTRHPSPVVAVLVHCGLSLSHHPSHPADYSPSCPSLRHQPQAIKTPRPTLPPPPRRRP